MYKFGSSAFHNFGEGKIKLISLSQEDILISVFNTLTFFNIFGATKFIVTSISFSSPALRPINCSSNPGINVLLPISKE